MKGKAYVRELLTGNHKTDNVILGTVSGVASTKTRLVEYIDRELPAIGLITTKSYQVTPNPGNREPIITEPEKGNFGNSVGLKNPGMEVALPELASLRERHDMRALLNVSVSASTPEDFIILVKAFAEVADLIELNFSCPHASAGFGASIGCDEQIASDYMRTIRDAVGDDFPALIIPKLTPNVEDIGSIAKALIEAGADGLAAINTVGPICYLEDHTQAPILNNKLGGKGGMSGDWVKTRALEAIAEIREAIGESYPIIGMGGISEPEDVKAMIEAGADTVGIGSAFGRLHQRDWTAYTNAMLAGEPVDSYLCDHEQMSFTPCRLTKIVEHSPGVKVFYTDGKLDCGPGQFAFIWLPGVGEKPFSIAESEPLTFIIKDRGEFTHAMMDLNEGDDIYVRGVYGEPVETAKTKEAVILAGGTGIAVVPSLVKKLSAQGTEITCYYGASGNEEDSEKALLEDELKAYGKFVPVYDNGVPGRVISVMDRELEISDDCAFYTIGPEIFMGIAAEIMNKRGLTDERIFLSMERPSLCGIGMCGECACGDVLTCQYGTFVRLDFLKSHAPELL